jgi:superfamily II DNA or RNA helicase
MENNITKEFKKFKIPISNEKMEDFCLPKKFTLQPQQKLLPEVLSSKTFEKDNNNRGILVYHQIGAGKTCTAIAIAEKFKKKLNIVVVLPAALVGNFTNELRSECPEDEYLTDDERKKIKNLKPGDDIFESIMKKSEERIKKYYTIYSYHKFVALIKEEKIKKLNDTLLIIDEVQNMISLNGTFYKALTQVIEKSNESLKIVLLSATPMFDKPIEIALTLNLLIKNKDDMLPITKFNQTFIKTKKTNDGYEYRAYNMKKFRDKIKNMISYYRGAPPQAYPTMKFKTVKCNMSKFQHKSYLTTLSSEDNFLRGSFKDVDILNMPQNFFLGPRMISNISFPNKSIGDLGFSSFSGDALQIQNIDKYSIKFAKIMKKINQSEGPIFVYSGFKELGGLKCFIKFIEAHGYKNYMTYGEGAKRFSIWSGDETNKVKDEIKYIFNQKSNSDGSKIKIMLGSPSIKEGVSLLRVEQVHILEPYWNMSRMLQILGRAVRFCSHKDVPKRKRIVKVYLYLATYLGTKTIDQYIWSLAKKKNKLIEQFELALKETAFDCELFYNRNVYKTDEIKIKCKK